MHPFLKSISILVLLTVLLFGASGKASADVPVIYVKWNAAGANNGTSWTNAYTSLQTALAAALSPAEIWVAAGTYKPTTTTDRTISLTLKNGVGIYGGFIGTETLRSQRDPVAHVTRLSGDIGTTRDWSDNSHHVVYASYTNSTAVLDGFTIYAGNANVSSLTYFLGGGMYMDSGSPTLANLIFDNNWATGKGGGMYIDASSPTLANVTFSNNIAGGGGIGGGMYNGNSSPSLTNVIFDGNTADSQGGGMYNHNSSPSLTNVTFSGNESGSDGGGMMNYSGSSPSLTNVTFSGNTADSQGGGLANWNNCSPTLTNVTFSGNSSIAAGGGMLNYATSSPSLTNVTFSGNTSATGGGMYNFGGAPEIYNSIFWGNSSEIFNFNISAEIHDSIVAGGCPANSSACSNILNLDPNLGALANNGGFTQTMALSVGSPALEAGNDATCAATDQRGVTRPQWLKCDMGAFELVFFKVFIPLVIRP
jgi:hypothetical protein